MIKNLVCVILLTAATAGAAEAPLAVSRGKLTVKANINTEVFNTILNLAGSSADLRNTAYMPVYDDAMAWFAAYKDHPAVKEVDAGGALNWNTGFSYNVPAEFPLYFSDLPEGRKTADYSKEFLDRLDIPGTGPADLRKKAAYMDAYWEKVKDFYKASSFGAYWEKERPKYAGFVADLYAALPEADIVKLHEDYHGEHGFASFTAIPSPLALPSGGNYGPSVKGLDGLTRVYNIMSTSRRQGGGPDFRGVKNAELMALHEFGHPFCNPVVAKYSAELARYSFLLRGLRGKVDDAYSDWTAVMNELLVRSVHGRLLLKLRGEAAAKDYLENERGHEGFIFIYDWDRLLGEYEADRAKYPALYDFYPRLAAELEDWGVYELQEPRPLGAKWVKPVPGGARIVKAETYGAAYAAGLRNGDTVTAVDGAPVTSAAAYAAKSRAFDSLPAGGSMTFTVQRSSGSAEVKVERGLGGFMRVVRLGAEYRNVRRRAPRAQGLFWAGFGPEGMSVGFAAEDKPAWQAGVRKGDVVKAAGGVQLTSREAYEKAGTEWEKLPEGGVMMLTVLRGGKELTFEAKSDKWEEITETVKI